MEFSEWIKQVDEEVIKIAFVSMHDLADMDFRGMYEDGYTPEDAAKELLAYNDFPPELLDW